MNLRPLWLLLPFTLLTACDRDVDPDPPAELVQMKNRIEVDKVWSTSLSGEKHLRLGLRPATFDGTQIYVADHDGDIVAFSKDSGRTQWRTKTELPLSGGPAAGFGRVVAGSTDGEVVALDAKDGRELWKKDVGGEVLAAPAIGEAIVVVRTVDGKLRGLNAADGAELWLVEQQVPRLSVRGTAAPVIAGDLVLCGFDNGKVVAVTLKEGETAWETPIASSRGRTELERMVDIDSAVRVVDKDVFVVGFQAKAAMLALDSGQVWWARDASSDTGLVVGDEAIYLSSANGDVMALNKKDGSPVWEQSALHRRGLSGPALDGPTLVVADFEGYVHWLDTKTGEVLARAKTDGERVTNTPLVTDSMVFVLTDAGTLAAFRRTGAQAASTQPKPAPAPESVPPTTDQSTPAEPPADKSG